MKLNRTWYEKKGKKSLTFFANGLLQEKRKITKSKKVIWLAATKKKDTSISYMAERIGEDS